MNKDKRNNIQLLGTLNNSDESGIIANANQIYDANEDKSTQDVSKEHTERIKDLETKEDSMQTTLENISKTGEASAASNVTYNHSNSKLNATNVQQAIDESLAKKADKETVKTELAKKFDKENIVQEFGDSEDKVVSQSALPFRYIQSEEFIFAKVDGNDKLLFGIQWDGTPVFGKTSAVEDRLQSQVTLLAERVATIIGDEDTTNVIDTMNELKKFFAEIENTETLTGILANLDNVAKNLDKTTIKDEEGNVQDTPFRVIKNEEFIMAVVDSDDRVLFGFYRATGKPYYPQNDMYHISQSEEFLWFILDAENHPLLGIQQDGTCWAAKAQWLDDIKAIKEALSSIDETLKTFQPKEDGKGLINIDVADSFFYISNDEYIIAVVDAENRILAGIKYDAQPYFPNHEMYSVITNEEWLYAIIDAENKVLSGFRADDGHMVVGGIDISTFISNAIIDIADIKERTAHLSVIDNDEYLSIETDAEGKVIGYIASDGSHYLYKIKSETIPTEFEHIEDPEGRTEITTDAEGKILSERNADGEKYEQKMCIKDLRIENPDVFVSFLKEKGYNINACDMSAESYIRIPNQPRKAIVNITGVFSMPSSKTANYQAWMEVFTLEGIYFKKRIILNAQGSSSLYLAKKNFAVDICNDEWIGDDTCKVKIGNWVSQDSFHFKAYYTDAFRGVGVVCYKLFDEISKSRGLHNDRAYKRYYKDSTSASYGINQNAEIAYDFGDEARTFPDGFPCIVYLNGEFLGIFSWQLKKHRDNMKMSKNKAENIHLDGFIRDNLFSANGTLPSTAWNPMSEQGFEIRNPKSLICMDGSKYDADKNKVQELIDDTSESYDASNKNMKLSFQVKKYIIALSKYNTELTEVEAQIEAGSKTKDDIKKEINNRYDVDGIIDYLCFSNVVANYDGFGKNWQICSWNGVRFGIYPYDLDGVFGAFFDGTFSFSPKDNFMEPISLMGNKKGYGGTYWVYKYFATELKKRYSELRKSILTADNIINLLTDWCSRIGTDDFKQEYDRWKQSPCHRDSNINTEYYIPCTYTDAGITASGQKVWNKDTTYTAGSYVVFEHLAFKVIKDCTNVSPVTKYYSERPFYLGHYDSIYRVKKWLEERLPLVDNLINSLT